MSSFHNSEQPPLFWDAFECLFAAVLEPDSGTRDEIGHRSRDKDFGRARERRDSCADVNGDAPDIIASQLHFSGVQTGAHFDAERPDRLDKRARTPDRFAWPVECREMPVAGRIDEPASEFRDLNSGDAVNSIEKLLPASIAKLRGAFCRAD